MEHCRPLLARTSTLVLAALAALVTMLVVGAGLAHATPSPFPITESFTGSTMEPHWQTGGNAALTAPSLDADGSGWMRLTPAVGAQFGFVFNDESFPSNNGILAEFDYATWGGSGADGLTFFLYDGATSADDFQIGPSGGALGYMACGTSHGLHNAYIGVGFDEFGNFANTGLCEPTGFGVGEQPNRVTVRGSEANDYEYLTSAAVPEGLEATRDQARKIKISITPDMKLSVYITFPDGTIQTVTHDFQLSTTPGDLPADLKLGFGASTGGSTNNHEIRNTQVVMPVDLATTVTDGATGANRTDQRTWTATVTNTGPNPTSNATVKATPGAGMTNLSWTCTPHGTAVCATASGTGIPDTMAGFPTIGDSVTYAITADVDPTADDASMTVVADTGAGEPTGESNPTNNSATDTTDLTPVDDDVPTASLPANGHATQVTTGNWRGGNLVFTRNWQRCDADGTNCADISAAAGTAYTTQPDDVGHTLRLRVHATNSAGSADAYSAPFTLPDTTIASGPDARTASDSATFALTTTGAPGTTYECSLDGAAYTGCTGSPTFAGLDEGDHTLSVRGKFGGLVDPSPATYAWTVDSSTSVALTAPTPGIIATRHPTVTGTAEPGTTMTVAVDGTTVATGVAGSDGSFSIALPADLPDGDHTIAVTATDDVGNTDTKSSAITVDATAPDVPNVTAGPSSTTNAKDATFTVAAQESSTFRCRLDGGEWTDCTMPHTVTGLADGPHTLSVIAIDEAGNESPRVDRTWTVDTTPPAAPPAMTSPSTKSTGSTARFVFSLEPGSTLECAVDGGAFAPCDPTVELTGLKDGHHTLTVRQIDAAGNAGAPATYEWTVADTVVPTARIATKVGTMIGARVTVSDNRILPVGCRIDQANLTTCRVQVFTTTAAGRQVLIGTGSRTLRGPGHASAVVSVTLNATGRRLLGQAVGGLKVTLKTTGKGTGSKGLSATGHTVLFPQHLAVLPTINPFVFDSTKMMTKAAGHALKTIAADIRHAKSVTCVGHTDSAGNSAYNKALGLRRAKAVCAQLRHLGVHARQTVFSDGETQPRATNRTAAGRLSNRRVELRIGY